MMRGNTLMFAVAFAGCAPNRSFGPVNECVVEISDSIYAHACQHARRGPFHNVTAQVSASDATPVSVIQRVLTVAMPNSPEQVGYLRYRPTRDGAHAVFSGERGNIVAVTATGPEGTPLREVSVVSPSQDCGGLPWITGFEFKLGSDYLLAIGPTEATEVRIFIEHLGTFGAPGWDSQCDF